MPTIRLTIEYDGADFNGWQIQSNGIGVQSVLQAAIRRMTKESNQVIGASRTDAGVHALGQVAHFQTRRHVPPKGWVRGLNSVLPPTIRVRVAEEVPTQFHARRDARWKRYRYVILQGTVYSPFLRQRVWHLPLPLNVAAMRRAGTALIGRHDFTTFAAANDGSRSKVREVYAVRLRRIGRPALVRIDVIGDGFLKQMVRNIVGTLVEVGAGRRPVEEMRRLLAARDRRSAGRCAPARGLYLMEVGYAGYKMRYG